MPSRFRHFLAIDWSGAAGERHKGIALALADASGGPPVLVERGRGWSRAEVLDLLLNDLPTDTLVGMDLGFSLPFADRSAYFPGWAESPADARDLWALVERLCVDDPHLGAIGMVDHPEASAHFRRHGGREGTQFGGGRGRFRVTERAQEALGCRPYSNFNLVGAAQVGKSSLSGMRLLHALQHKVAIWPFDPLPATGAVLVEIYTTIAAIAGGRSAGRAKMRHGEELDEALAVLGSPPVRHFGEIDDHSADALVSAAWLRARSGDARLWAPATLTPDLARTEGWTFGAT